MSGRVAVGHRIEEAIGHFTSKNHPLTDCRRYAQHYPKGEGVTNG